MVFLCDPTYRHVTKGARLNPLDPTLISPRVKKEHAPILLKKQGLVNVPSWGFVSHHLQISVGYYIPNSRVMFNWDIYQPLKNAVSETVIVPPAHVSLIHFISWTWSLSPRFTGPCSLLCSEIGKAGETLHETRVSQIGKNR